MGAACECSLMLTPLASLWVRKFLFVVMVVSVLVVGSSQSIGGILTQFDCLTANHAEKEGVIAGIHGISSRKNMVKMGLEPDLLAFHRIT